MAKKNSISKIEILKSVRKVDNENIDFSYIIKKTGDDLFSQQRNPQVSSAHKA